MTDLAMVPQQNQWHKLKALVLDSVSSPITKRVYNLGLDEFFRWFSLERRNGFTKAAVAAWRVALEARGLGAVSINVRITAVRKLAVEAGDNGLLAPEIAAGITRVKGVASKGVRLGNWLSAKQAQTLLNTPDVTTTKGLRDRAILAVLLGCGLRRSEVAALTFAHVQQRDGRWCIVDLVGKHGRVRTVPMPTWVKVATDAWTSAATVTDGPVFRACKRGGQAQPVFSMRSSFRTLREARGRIATLYTAGGQPVAAFPSVAAGTDRRRSSRVLKASDHRTHRHKCYRIYCCDGTRFALETLTEILLRDFYSNSAAESRVAGLVHFAHASSADWRENFARTKMGSRCKRHDASNDCIAWSSANGLGLDYVFQFDGYLTDFGETVGGRWYQSSMLDYLDNRNDHPKPFVWKADADLILGKIERLCKRISRSEHDCQRFLGSSSAHT